MTTVIACSLLAVAYVLATAPARRRLDAVVPDPPGVPVQGRSADPGPGADPAPGGDAERGGGPGAWLARARRVITRRRERETRARGCAELCQGMAAELRAGRTATDALERAVSELAAPVRASLAPAVAAARSAGDVETALTRLGHEPGLGGLAGLAACWRVGAETGTGFAAVLDRYAETLNADLAHRAEVSAQLAGARSSARLLAALPVVGMALAAGLGTNPLTFLLGTPYGLACLAAGTTLDAAGLWWTHRLAASAEGST